jgi:hypothetical protein
MNEMINKEKPHWFIDDCKRKRWNNFRKQWRAICKRCRSCSASVVLSSDDYLKIQRLIESGVPVTLDVEVKTKFYLMILKGIMLLLKFQVLILH